MRLDPTECWARLDDARHGVLATVHPTRGVDAVPVVFVVHDGQVVLPIDTVKAKSGPRLQRLRNLEADPRAVLLVDRYEADWSALWWVRAHGRGREAPPTPPQRDRLAAAFPAYRDAEAITAVIVFEVDEVTGWRADRSER
jgi:PPOX class probable F420-dependent enzyme